MSDEISDDEIEEAIAGMYPMLDTAVPLKTAGSLRFSEALLALRSARQDVTSLRQQLAAPSSEEVRRVIAWIRAYANSYDPLDQLHASSFIELIKRLDRRVRELERKE